MNQEEVPVIAITGASGFVGHHLVKFLAAYNYPIIAITRSQKYYEQPINNVTVRKANILNSTQMKNAIAGASIVIHTAGIIDPHGSRAELFNTNAHGTKIILEIAKNANIKQFIHMSSLSVITGVKDCYDVTEEKIPKYSGEAYGDSKILAEKFAIDFDDQNGMRVTVLRPGFIYGQYENSWVTRLVNSLKNNQVMIIGDGSKETNLIGIDNLCEATRLSILNPNAYGEKFNLTDGIKVTKKELLDTLAKALNLPPVTRQVNERVAYLACHLVTIITPILAKSAKKKLSRLSLPAYRLMGVNQGFNIDKAKHMLNYSYIVSFEEGMQKTIKPYIDS